MISSKSKVAHKKLTNGGFQVGESPFAVKVYKRKDDKGYVLYYKSGTKERRESRLLKNDALTRAKEIHLNLKAGVPCLVVVNQHELASFIQCKLDLTRNNLPNFDIAIREYVTAAELLPEGTSLIEAVRFFASKRQQVQEVLISQAISEFLVEREKGIDPYYFRQEQIRLGKFSSSVNGYLSDLSKQVLRAYLDTLAESAGKTQNNHRGSLRTFIKWAVKRGFLDRENYLLEELEPLRATTQDPDPYNTSEVKGILATCSEDLKPIIALQAFAGARRNEAIRLDWEDVFKIPGYVELASSKAKTRSRRLFKITPQLESFLGTEIGSRSGKIWAGSNHSYGHSLSNALKRSGVKSRRNGFRCAFISHRLAQLEGDSSKVAAEAGNSPEMIYRHYRELKTEMEAKEYFLIMNLNS